uniref:hypothetical protein n=1 Tax=Flavobacterium sp. TaxID=239 RepID=UPI004049FAD3
MSNSVQSKVLLNRIEVKDFLNSIEDDFEISAEAWNDSFSTIKSLLPAHQHTNKRRKNTLLSVLRSW